MEIKTLSNSTLLEGLSVLVKEERKITLEVLKHLREVERRRLFAEEGFPSLFEFCTKRLGYSEGSAQRRISSMRLLKELPELEEKIQDGSLKLSTLAQAQSFFRKEEIRAPEAKKEILMTLENQSSRQVERCLSPKVVNPKNITLKK